MTRFSLIYRLGDLCAFALERHMFFIVRTKAGATFIHPTRVSHVVTYQLIRPKVKL